MHAQQQPGRAVVVLGLESRYAFDAIDTLHAAGVEIRACIPSDHDTECAGTFPKYSRPDASTCDDAEFIVPLLTPGRRKLRALEGVRLGMRPSQAICHPSSVVSGSAQLARGGLVGPLAALGANVICGVFFMANRLASAGHDCVFGDFCTIGPSATVCGGCIFEDGVYVGAGAVVLPKVRIGKNSVVGAGAVVTREVLSHTVVAGNPARVIGENIAGYRDIGV